AASRLATFLCFFFQAEDGIRDPLVTGVQTCALPISAGANPMALKRGIEKADELDCFFDTALERHRIGAGCDGLDAFAINRLRERSEERRVGKADSSGIGGTRDKYNKACRTTATQSSQ